MDGNHGIGSRGSSDKDFFACSGLKIKKKQIVAGILERSASSFFSSD